MRSVRVLIAAILVAASFAAPAVAAPPSLPDEPPNIVVFYIDDAAPHDGRLWNDPSRTPNIHEQFIEHGIDLENAIGEDPLCCPARGNLLTGQHTHNNRVLRNEAVLFDPAVHIGKSMKDAGYASLYIGKFLNKNGALTSQQWAAHDAGWTELDAIRGKNGKFYDFRMHTKSGDVQYNGVHSTKVIGDRMVQRLRETPSHKPVFAILSVFNVHAPNTPQPEDIGDPRCASMPPWNPPNYNEEDVSDKPPDIQALNPLPYPDGWPMVRYCEEMLGVDRMVGQVVDELRDQGRLDNTLLVFTADNGMEWGQHRLGQVKARAYASPVPLYVRWPAANWGDSHQVQSEIVSNIDLAPTFCALAQTCVLGPYPRGSAAPDGLSLVGLLNGDVANLGRTAVMEVEYSRQPSWAALRTTAAFHPTNRWHYTEYFDGFRELYDSVNDPWELDNLAYTGQHNALMATLHEELAALRVEGIGAGNGSITIVQDARPNSGFDFHFSGDLGNFALDDDKDPTLANSRTFTNLPSGQYNISRTLNPIASLSAVTCDGVSAFVLADGKLSVFLHPTESITCTFIDALPQPDLGIRKNVAKKYKKNNFYRPVPVKKQTIKRKKAVIGVAYSFWIKVQNDSRGPDTLHLDAWTTGPTTPTVTITDPDGEDVTGDILSGGYEVDLAAGEVVHLHMVVTLAPGTLKKPPFKMIVRATSAADPDQTDVVRAVVRR